MQIVAAARAQIHDAGSLEFNISRLSAAVGMSRSLFWSYFANGEELVVAIFTEQTAQLHACGMAAACRAGSIEQRLSKSGTIYLRGLLGGALPFYYFLRDGAANRIAPGALTALLKDLAHLMAAARRDLLLTAREARAWIEMLTGIPEELARLVRRGEIDDAQAMETCDRLLRAAVAGVAPVDRLHFIER